jgi:hypothetical protein
LNVLALRASSDCAATCCQLDILLAGGTACLLEMQRLQ